MMLCYLWCLNLAKVNSIENIKTFDPYEILGVQVGDNERTIKKAYRQMSLIWHPDKNPENPEATAEFIKLTKAYNVSQQLF